MFKNLLIMLLICLFAITQSKMTHNLRVLDDDCNSLCEDFFNCIMVGMYTDNDCVQTNDCDCGGFDDIIGDGTNID